MNCEQEASVGIELVWEDVIRLAPPDPGPRETFRAEGRNLSFLRKRMWGGGGHGTR